MCVCVCVYSNTRVVRRLRYETAERSQIKETVVSVCLIGLFAYSHMEFEVDRDKGQNGDPPLHEMAVKALSILQKNNKGFFLFVESEYIHLEKKKKNSPKKKPRCPSAQ